MNKRRLLKYIQHELGIEFKKFQLMDIGLIKEDKNIKKLKKLEKKYIEIEEIITEVKKMNRLLRKHYTGEYKVGFTFNEKSKNVEDLNIESRRKIILRKKFNEFFEEIDRKRRLIEKNKKNS